MTTPSGLPKGYTRTDHHGLHVGCGRFYVNLFLSYADWALGFDRWPHGNVDLWLGPISIGWDLRRKS